MIQFLKEYSVDEIIQLCGGEEPLRAIKFAMSILNIICFITPILLIVLITVSFTKNVIAQSVDDMKKEFLIVLKKIISCVALFLVPTIVSVAMSVLGNLGIDYVACVKASKEDDLSKYKIDVTPPENKNNYSFKDNNKTTIVDGNKNKKDLNNNIFIGDSRTVGMKKAVENNQNDIWIAESGKGYTWFNETALPDLQFYLKKDEETHYNIFINLGVNDLHNIDNYKKSFESLGSKLKEHNVIIVSVNPVDESTFKSKHVTNEKINNFNKEISTINNVIYCDTYSRIKDNFSTTDGLHYKASTYKKIYKEMKNCL